MRPLILATVQLLFVMVAASAQSLIPVEWGEGRAVVVQRLGEPDRESVNADTFYDRPFYGFDANLTVYYDADDRVSGAAFGIYHATEAAWSELVDAVERYLGAPDDVYYLGTYGQRIARSTAVEIGVYVHQAEWSMDDAALVVGIMVGENGNVHMASISPSHEPR